MLGICPLQIPSIRSFETLCCYWLSLDISSRDFSLPNWCPTPAFLLMLLPNCHPLAQKEQPPPLYTNRGVGFAICFFFFFFGTTHRRFHKGTYHTTPWNLYSHKEWKTTPIFSRPHWSVQAHLAHMGQWCTKEQRTRRVRPEGKDCLVH